MQYEHVIYEVADAIGVITLNRPEAANAQSHKVLEELDHAWKEADRDSAVKVIVFKANGKHFSAGHDMSGQGRSPSAPTKYDADTLYDWEHRHYLHYAKTWREVPKPSIAAVQGKCIAGGLIGPQMKSCTAGSAASQFSRSTRLSVMRSAPSTCVRWW